MGGDANQPKLAAISPPCERSIFSSTDAPKGEEESGIVRKSLFSPFLFSSSLSLSPFLEWSGSLPPRPPSSSPPSFGFATKARGEEAFGGCAGGQLFLPRSPHPHPHASKIWRMQFLRASEEGGRKRPPGFDASKAKSR